MEREFTGPSPFTEKIERIVKGTIPIKGVTSLSRMSLTIIVNDVASIEVYGDKDDGATCFILCIGGIPKHIVDTNDKDLIENLQIFAFSH